MTASAVVLLAALVVAAASLALARRSIGSVRVPLFAAPRGSEAGGVRYAFTTAFLPWAKESASAHLATYLAGIVYHAGIFAALAWLVLTLTGFAPSRRLALAIAALLALATGAAAALAPGAVPPFQLAGAALLLYAPLGKLRHMLFLVTSRRQWGAYYGRRGVRG